MKKAQDLEARLAHSTTDHDKAADIARAATDAHENARAVYVANPTEDAGSAVLRTRDAHELASARFAHAKGIRDAAQADLDALRATEEAARLEAEAEGARVARDAHLANLRELASPTGHAARIAAALAVIVAAEPALLDAFGAILSSFGESNAAASELRHAGEAVDDLDAIHVLGPLLVARPGAVPVDLNPLRHAGSAHTSPNALAPRAPLALLVSFVQLVMVGGGQMPASDEHASALRSELALRLQARTFAEAEATIRTRHDERAAQLAARRPGRAVAPTDEARAGDEDEDGPVVSIIDRARSFFSADTPGAVS
jgi:hypothetical protein